MFIRTANDTSHDQVKILHLSDLHFSEHAYAAAKDSCHSVEHLIDLRRRISQLQFDRAVISGDLSDRGNLDALLRARDFLFGQYSIGNGKKVGLELDEEISLIVPGNHDAFNTKANGDTLTRWQNSIENYNNAFPKHILKEDGCRYSWVEREGWGVYVALADTCFFGDPLLERSGDSVTPFDAIAKGKLARSQAQRLLSWYDAGMRGKLPKPGGDGLISADLFAGSFKVLVMHHYIFEPANCKYDYMMGLCDRHDVFRNIAMANFDVLLCGHKHVPDFGCHTYGFHLDNRGRRRYILNHFRRTIGIGSLPLQYTDGNGKKWPTYLSLGINLILENIRSRMAARQVDECEELINILKEGLEDSKGLRSKMKAITESWVPKGESQLSTHEIEEIERRLNTEFSVPERKQLAKNLADFDTIIRRLNQRQFVQVLAGSATKRPRTSDKPRSFNLHSIERNSTGYNFRSERFPWDYLSKQFVAEPEVASHSFKSAW